MTDLTLFQLKTHVIKVRIDLFHAIYIMNVISRVDTLQVETVLLSTCYTSKSRVEYEKRDDIKEKQNSVNEGK